MIRDTNTSYERLPAQMERIANYFGAPPTRHVPGPQETNTLIKVPTKRNPDQLTENRVLRRGPLPNQEEPERVAVLVNGRQNSDQVVIQACQDNYESHNNIANLVKNLLAQNGFNMSFRKTQFHISIV